LPSEFSPFFFISGHSHCCKGREAPPFLFCGGFFRFSLFFRSSKFCPQSNLVLDGAFFFFCWKVCLFVVFSILLFTVVFFARRRPVYFVTLLFLDLCDSGPPPLLHLRCALRSCPPFLIAYPCFSCVISFWFVCQHSGFLLFAFSPRFFGRGLSFRSNLP